MSHVALALLLSPTGCAGRSTAGPTVPLTSTEMVGGNGVLKATDRPISTAAMRARLQFVFPPVFIEVLSATKVAMLHRAIVQRLRDRSMKHVSSELRDMLQQSLYEATLAHNASPDSKCGKRHVMFDEVVTNSELCDIVYLAFKRFDRRLVRLFNKTIELRRT